MFGWGRRGLAERAKQIGQAVMTLRSVCEHKSFDEMTAWMVQDGYTKCSEHIDPISKTASFAKGAVETADMLYTIRQYTIHAITDGTSTCDLQILAEGYHRLRGLYVISSVVGHVSVEVSDVLRASGEIGADALALQKIMLNFPGFINYKSMFA